MQFLIEVLSVSRETKSSAAGRTYVMLEVAYKNLSNGKVEGKKLIPFGENKKAYDSLNNAKSGSQFTITTEKGEPNQAGIAYWQWLEAVPIAPGEAVTPQQAKTTPTITPKSTYETPEERAKKQVYIIKQSSIGAAIELLSIGAKSPPNLQSIIDCAQHLTNWVLQENLATMPNDNLDGEIV